MRIVFKLLFGLGKGEEYNPTPTQIFITAIALLTAFLGSVLSIMTLTLYFTL